MVDLEDCLSHPETILVKLPGVLPFKRIGHLCGYVMREASLSSASFSFEKKVSYDVQLIPVVSTSQSEYSKSVRTFEPRVLLNGELKKDDWVVRFDGSGEPMPKKGYGFRQVRLQSVGSGEKSLELLHIVEKKMKRYFSLAHTTYEL